MYKITCVRTGTCDRPNRQLKGRFEKTFESLDEFVSFAFNCKYFLCFPRLKEELGKRDFIVVKRKFAAMHDRRRGKFETVHEGLGEEEIK